MLTPVPPKTPGRPLSFDPSRTPRQIQLPSIPEFEVSHPRTPQSAPSVILPPAPELESPMITAMPTPRFEPSQPSEFYGTSPQKTPQQKTLPSAPLERLAYEINGFFNWFFRF